MDVAGHGVPLEAHVFHPVLADDVQVVLILCDLEGDALQQTEEHVQEIAFAHGVQIHQQHAGVEVMIRRHPQALLGVQRQRRDGTDHTVRDCPHQIVLQVHVVQLRHVAQQHHVAVQVQRLVKPGKQIGNEQAVVGGFGIIVPGVELVGKLLHGLGDVDKLHGKALGGKAFRQPPDILRIQTGVEDSQGVIPLGIAVLLQRRKRHREEGDVGVVTGEK